MSSHYLILQFVANFIMFEMSKILDVKASRGSRMDSTSAHCAGGLPIESRHPTSATCM